MLAPPNFTYSYNYLGTASFITIFNTFLENNG